MNNSISKKFNNTVLFDSSSNEIDVHLQSDGSYHLGVAVNQNVISSSGNSSTNNLNSNATFTGTSISTSGTSGIQVNLKTDQNCTVYVDQSSDGTNWDIIDTYMYYASIGNFGVTAQAVSSYVRVRVTNTGLSATTYFRLQTVLCPIVESLPRSLDSLGDLRVGIKSAEDHYGFEAENTPMGEMRISPVVRLTGANFDGTTVDSNFWTSTVANSATIAQANGEIILTSGTDSAGSAKLNSFRRARYVSGNAMRFRGVIQLGDTGIADNTRKWGIAFGATMPTITDGAYFQLSGTTFSIVTLKNTTPTVVSSGSFNGILGNEYTIDTNAEVYEIYYTNTKVYFIIDNRVLHTVSANTTTWSDTVNHYIYFDNVNSGNTTSVTLKCRVASISRLGQLLTQPMSKYQLGTTAGIVCKYGAGNLHEVVVSGVAQNSTITLYDNTAASGTVIWSSGVMGAQTIPFSLDFKGIPFFIGLTLVIASASSNVLVAYE